MYCACKKKPSCNHHLVKGSAHLSAREQNLKESAVLIYIATLHLLSPHQRQQEWKLHACSRCTVSRSGLFKPGGSQQRLRLIARSVWLQYSSTTVCVKLLKSWSEIIFLALQGCLCAVDAEMEKSCAKMVAWRGNEIPNITNHSFLSPS